MTMLTEIRLTLTELAHREGVNPCTVWRWAGRGVRGIVLETFTIGGRRYTTAEAFDRWVTATTAAASGRSPGVPARQPSNGIAAAEKKLAALGF
jgi:hypothetical protein